MNYSRERKRLINKKQKRQMLKLLKSRQQRMQTTKRKLLSNIEGLSNIFCRGTKNLILQTFVHCM